jgi:hypothetical protein
MAKLITINGLNDNELLSGLLSDEIIVYEDIQGSKIWVNWNGKEFTIRPKSLTNDAINLIDLAMQNYYNPVINYFTSLDERVKGLLNRKWSFCFEYFPDNQPANIEYDRVPKNQLVLSSINKSGKYEFNIEEKNTLPLYFKHNIESTKYKMNELIDLCLGICNDRNNKYKKYILEKMKKKDNKKLLLKIPDLRKLTKI